MSFAAVAQMIVCAALSVVLLWAMVFRPALPKIGLTCALVPSAVVACAHGLRATFGDGWAVSDGTQDLLSLLSFVGLVIAAIWAYRA